MFDFDGDAIPYDGALSGLRLYCKTDADHPCEIQGYILRREMPFFTRIAATAVTPVTADGEYHWITCAFSASPVNVKAGDRVAWHIRGTDADMNLYVCGAATGAQNQLADWQYAGPLTGDTLTVNWTRATAYTQGQHGAARIAYGSDGYRAGFAYGTFGTDAQPRYVMVNYNAGATDITVYDHEIFESAGSWLYGASGYGGYYNGIWTPPGGAQTMWPNSGWGYGFIPAAHWNAASPMAVGRTGFFEDFTLQVRPRTSNPWFYFRLAILRQETEGFRVVDARDFSGYPFATTGLAWTSVTFATLGWGAWASGRSKPWVQSTDVFAFFCPLDSNSLQVASYVQSTGGYNPTYDIGWMEAAWATFYDGSAWTRGYLIPTASITPTGRDRWSAPGIGWCISRAESGPSVVLGAGFSRPFLLETLGNAHATKDLADLVAQIAATKTDLLPDRADSSRVKYDGGAKLQIQPAMRFGHGEPLADPEKLLTLTDAAATFMFRAADWTFTDIGTGGKIAALLGQLVSAGCKWKLVILHETETQWEFVSASGWFDHSTPTGQTYAVYLDRLCEWLSPLLNAAEGNAFAIVVQHTAQSGATAFAFSGTSADLDETAEWYIAQEVTQTTDKSSWTNNSAPEGEIAVYVLAMFDAAWTANCANNDLSGASGACLIPDAKYRGLDCCMVCAHYDPGQCSGPPTLGPGATFELLGRYRMQAADAPVAQLFSIRAWGAFQED
jgi:hypothetical protein